MNYSAQYAGKSVALIGPAPHIPTYSQAEYIAGFDVVVRVNSALPVPEAVARATTGRTDVLYACWHIDPDEESWLTLSEIRIRPNAVWQWLCHGLTKRYNQFRNLEDKVVWVHPKLLYDYRRNVGTNPNTGMMAAADILDCGPRLLYVTGFTFFQGPEPYDPDYAGRKNPKEVMWAKDTHGNFVGHDQAKQLAWFRDTVDNGPCKIEMDDELYEIVYP